MVLLLLLCHITADGVASNTTDGYMSKLFSTRDEIKVSARHGGDGPPTFLASRTTHVQELLALRSRGSSTSLPYTQT